MTKGLHRVRSVNSGFVIGGKNFRAVATGAFLVLFALNMAVVFPPHTKQTADAATGTATDSVITYVGINDTASVSLGITSPLGTFATSTDGTNNTTDQRAKFTISTNNYTGYSVSMTSSSATNTLVDSDNDDTDTNNISSIPSAVVDTVFAADTEAGQALNNKWGFKPSYYESNANTDTFYPMLTSSDNVLIRRTTTANSANGIDNADEYTLSLGLRVNFATKQGTYTNDAFIVEYVANPITYSITYADNTGDSTVANLPYESATPPHVQTDMTDGTSIILSDIVPTRTGYDFTGWCNEVPTVTEGTSSCAGTVYNPNGAGTDLTYGIDKTSTNEATIYAMWAPKTYAVTVDFAGTGIESVTLTNATYDDATITTSGDTANLKYGVTYNIEATLTTDYNFVSWAATNGAFSSTTTNPATYTVAGEDTITATGKDPVVITFQAGDNINTIMVADGSDKYRPYYATSGAPAVFTNPTPGTKYLVTVIPEANNILSDWAGDTTELDSTTLLTTTYTVPDASATLTATGTAGAYSSMKDFALSSCTAATNLTDARDGKSYTVAPFVNGNTTYCYMLSNLRLDSGIELTSADSDINPNGVTYTDPTTSEPVTANTFTTPVSGNQNYYCRSAMNIVSNEYYYNWYAAKANPYPCTNPTASTNATAENDAYSLGSICPAGWTLPDYNTDITATMLWNNSVNLGNLITAGDVVGGSQYGVGNYGSSWSDARLSDSHAYRLYFSGTSVQQRGSVSKNLKASVRCVKKPTTLSFTAGEGINTIMVADGSNKYKPYYATNGSTIEFNSPAIGNKYIVTVIPEAGYVLDSWSGNTTDLASTSLLTTTYTVSANKDISLTATGTTGSYTAMKDLTNANCPAAGINVTDGRDNKSYTVAKIGNYCYMLSNLRLDSGTTLTSADSDINPNGVTYTDPTTGESVTATTFTTPTEAWTSSAQNYYCKAIMKTINNEYYYNWYAAKANPYQCVDPTTSTNATAENDAYSLGSICPAGWTLPDYNTDITTAALSNNNTNSGHLATTGGFYTSSQNRVGQYGVWWASPRNGNQYAIDMDYAVNNSGVGSAGRYNGLTKDMGFSVRCLRSS